MNKEKTLKLSMSALFAALCYIGFAYCKIDIPVGDGHTAFHLGNVFCVLGALLIGGLWGGLAGAVGLSIADLMDPRYILSAPKTFLMKLCIGLIAGLIAHKAFRISRDDHRSSLPVATLCSTIAAMAFNAVFDPIFGYLYKTYILGQPQNAAAALAKVAAVTTLVNAAVSVVAATTLYLAVRTALKKANLLPTL